MKNMMKVITTISVLSLVLITVGVTLAFYSYTRTGTTENTVQSSGITFIYTEIDGQGSGIGITDALPMSDVLGEAQTGDRNVFNYKIKSSNPTDKYINYTVTVRKKSTGTELDNYIKLNVKEVGGSYNQTAFYKDLELYNNLDNERIIYQGEVTNDPNYEKNFQLRMWLSDTLTLDENTNDKSFSVTVNVHASGSVTSQSNSGNTTSTTYYGFVNDAAYPTHPTFPYDSSAFSYDPFNTGYDVFWGIEDSIAKEMCIIYNGQLECFDLDNYADDMTHLERIFPQGSCSYDAAFNSMSCSDDNWYCYIADGTTTGTSSYAEGMCQDSNTTACSWRDGEASWCLESYSGG